MDLLSEQARDLRLSFDARLSSDFKLSFDLKLSGAVGPSEMFCLAAYLI